MKMVLASIFLLISLLSLNANSELVILRVYDSGNGSNTTTSSSDFQSCALYRNHVGLGSSPNYQLYDLNLFTYCSQFTVNSNTSFAQNAVFFMPKTPFDCSFRRMANNLLADGASLALIASDGPFNYSYVDPTNQVGMAFFPQYIGQSLQDKLNTYQLPYVNVYSFSTNQFDPSIIITLGIALITVIAIAEWNLYKFKKRLGKKAAKLKAPTSNNPEISTVTKGFEDAMMSNISGHPSINELPMPPMDSSSGLETNEPSSRTRGIEAKETANNKKEAVINKSKEVLNKTKQFVKSGKIMDFTFGYLNIAIICVVLVGLVLLVYYFYPVMVWIISVLFAIIACITLYVMGEKILSHRFLKFLHYRIPDNNIPVLKKKPKVISLVWLAICIAFCAIWLGFRRSDWAWVFQDIMVLCLVKYTLSFNLFRSYHVVMVLLGIICVYETFMIFILPLFAQRATIFSAVLFGFKTSYDSWYERPENYNYIDFTSPNSFDWLPLYLIIPNVYDFRKLCHRFLTFPYTVLGIGDIVFPAMSINYALIYDVAKGKRFPLFFFLNLVGYCFSYFLVGLIGSFVKTALPPMLFLAPILIAINTIIPYLYKDLQPYLNGDPIKDYTANQINQLLS